MFDQELLQSRGSDGEAKVNKAGTASCGGYLSIQNLKFKLPVLAGLVVTRTKMVFLMRIMN